MSLIVCKECSKEVSDSAVCCPHCGAKLKMHLFLKIFLSIIAILFFVFLIIMMDYVVTPEYKRDASKMRNVCERHMANNDPTTIMWARCQEAYYDAIRKGENIGKPIVPTPEFKEEKIKMEDSLKLERIEYANNCIKNKISIINEYHILVNKNDWYKAGLKVWRCAELTNDFDYKSLGEKAKKYSKNS